jgi:hypothetical protein
MTLVNVSQKPYTRWTCLGSRYTLFDPQEESKRSVQATRDSTFSTRPKPPKSHALGKIGTPSRL